MQVDLAAVRAMDRPQLEELASEIRSFLVSSLSDTGGHLGSNLGAVELTIALHRIFDSPRDRIVWDTGHQAYVHKLLTGRGDDFAGLRQPGGLSGYPNRAESDHDLVENSHASTALSYADGLAFGRRLQGDDHHVVAVVGDGALTGGLAYEALNNLGTAGRPVVVVVNDNGRSYAPTVSRLAGTCPASAAVAEQFFTALGFDYLGPVDGHCLGDLEVALEKAAGATGPVVVHVRTVKGRGYGPAEHDPEKCLHDVSPFDPDTGRAKAAKGPGYTEAFAAALCEEAQRRPEVVAITAAMPGPTGLLPFAARFPDRFLDVGIAEQHAVTAAAGMAMAGLRPVVAVYSTFLNRAWDQVFHDVALHSLPVVFCLDRAGVTGDDGPSHHGILDLALLTKVPGMTVFAPSSFEELPQMLHDALEITDGPVAIRWPKTAARRTDEVGHGLGARQLRSGGRQDVCLIGVGKMVAACEAAADELAERGIEATVWDARVAKPIDPLLLADAATHRVVLTAEDGILEGGVGASIAQALRCSRAHVLPQGLPLAFLAHGKADDILAEHGLDGPGLTRTALATLGALGLLDEDRAGALSTLR